MVSIVDCTLEYFLRNIKEDKIIAFGAGRKFIEFVTRHKLENNIEFVLDNFKIGTIDINGKIIEILPPEKLFLCHITTPSAIIHCFRIGQIKHLQ